MRKGKLVLTPLPLQAIYTVAQLARAVGISRRRLTRVFAKWNVVTLTTGAETWVPMSELEGKLEPLWDSILVAARADREIAGRKPRVHKERETLERDRPNKSTWVRRAGGSAAVGGGERRGQGRAPSCYQTVIFRLHVGHAATHLHASRRSEAKLLDERRPTEQVAHGRKRGRC